MKKASVKKPVVRKQAWYGWVPDLPDKRDRLYGAVYKISAKLPAKIDLRTQCPPVADQGQLGSCTANALAGALEFLELKNKQALVDLSRLFIYYIDPEYVEMRAARLSAMQRPGTPTTEPSPAADFRRGCKEAVEGPGTPKE